MRVDDIPPMSAKAFEVPAGATIRIIDRAGGQPGDLVVFSAEDMGEHISQAQTRVESGTFRPTVGHSLWSNAAVPRALMTIVSDTAPAHDLLYPACCRFALRRRFKVDRDGCRERLAEALVKWGICVRDVPEPLNLFFRVNAKEDGAMAVVSGTSRAGDHIELKAQVACVVAVAACSVPRADGRQNSGYEVIVSPATESGEV